ncbi:hypothetical protein G6045_06120 [Streptomyces sp. YC504]|uniref:Uncharacterized protein n=1 Tax=Streptomyces mesophilus TaxID=1775132 RepID=A0A6G4XCH7_9ACTN|nr:hypothetical protein [Streptomyces mesophilus]NGO75256.1 hypothetical protein [Streptomyces mesophilus]
MLNPIHAEAVIYDHAAQGSYPGDIHESVAWWMAACLVVTARTHHLYVAHDGHQVSRLFHQKACQGATNAQHYACTVHDLGHTDELVFLDAVREAGAPGLRIRTAEQTCGPHVVIALFGPDGKPLDEDAGLLAIRRMIAEDRVPIPVNTSSKGRIQPHP